MTDELGASFAQFWAAYPRRVSKRAAWQVWQKLAPDAALVAEILAALAWQTLQQQWAKDDGQFIPHASTWLHQARWEDEPPMKAQSPVGWMEECERLHGGACRKQWQHVEKVKAS